MYVRNSHMLVVHNVFDVIVIRQNICRMCAKKGTKFCQRTGFCSL